MRLILSAALCVLPAAAQVDQQRAAGYFREAGALCEREAGRLWGISLCGPMVIADAASKTIATSQPAPSAPPLPELPPVALPPPVACPPVPALPAVPLEPPLPFAEPPLPLPEPPLPVPVPPVFAGPVPPVVVPPVTPPVPIAPPLVTLGVPPVPPLETFGVPPVLVPPVALPPEVELPPWAVLPPDHAPPVAEGIDCGSALHAAVTGSASATQPRPFAMRLLLMADSPAVQRSLAPHEDSTLGALRTEGGQFRPP